jgi:hypothetical protein
MAPSADVAIEAYFIHDHNRIFVSDAGFTPGPFGRAIADMECSTEAVNAGLAGNFIALLAVSDAGIIDRIQSSRGWVRMDGKPVADTPEALVAGQHWYSVSLTLTGQPTGRMPVTTGALQDGGPSPNQTCKDWTDSAAGLVATGVASWEGGEWLSGLTNGCAVVAVQPLYCLEADVNAPLSAPPAAPVGARRAFVTGTTVLGNTSDSAADALCAQEGGSPRFLAMRATMAGASPISRFTLDGGWYRVDGVPVLPDTHDAGEFVAPLITLVDAGFFPTLLPMKAAWLGSNGLTTPSVTGLNCSNWTSAASGAQSLGWYPGATVASAGPFCNAPQPLFCFEN